jgi:hypothetical protein
MLHPVTTGERLLQTEMDRHHSCDASSIPVLQRSVDSMTATRAHRAKAAHFAQQTSPDSRSGTGEVARVRRLGTPLVTSIKEMLIDVVSAPGPLGGSAGGRLDGDATGHLGGVVLVDTP